VNAIQIKNLVETYMDSTRNGRFGLDVISQVVNDAIEKFVMDSFGDVDGKKIYGFQAIQQIRDNLYTLIKSTSPTVTTLSNHNTQYYSFGVNHINNPADYYEFVALETLIGGVSTYARPTTYNELGPLLEDTYKHPTNKQPFYLDDSTGYKIYREATGTLTSATLTYIKTPATYSCGTQSQLIGPGNNLTLGLDYIAVQTSVNNLVTYQSGQLFNAGSIQLVSGQVILASNTTTTDLPEKTHNEIAKIAASIMSGTITDYPRSQFAEKEAKGA